MPETEVPDRDSPEPEGVEVPADAPERTAPASRSAPGTSEAQPPVEGVHTPEGDEAT
jgi:hypothetical protein